MEVHHHSRAEGKKKFKEYFLEFLMIFIAVTLGFFAENIREHFADREKARQYLLSFMNDLTNDETQLPDLIASIRHQQIRPADSLPSLLKNADTGTPANSIYMCFRLMIRQQGIRAFITDRTIEEVKNAGEMRLITNRQISDSLIDYYNQVGFVAYLQESLFEMKRMLTQNIRPVLNGYEYSKLIDSTDHIINPKESLYLLSTDKAAINGCLMSISEIKGLSITIVELIRLIERKAENIKELIRNKYHLRE